ncbi:hypothetical protein CANARDRAFT_27860 [[Candida] arabinofermentans NRRL YB-2248]|uniref:ER membrane protein complex subunit 2 n=1 Tax=[Candida] arabinofermentans NRRL YB-2248 TaxID=983967 RepID=A0A1E4T1Y9_9ASCO|nr:hypothetical protein CANARDRAFT_27860 [[Candida] arabinofermentans NRRL YB-2248]
MMSIETRDRLLTLHRTGKYATLTPSQSLKFYNLNGMFIETNESKLTSLQYYALLELQFFLSLMTMHDIEAKVILDKLSDQFDTTSSEKLVVLKSYYLESTSTQNRDNTNEQILAFLEGSQNLSVKKVKTAAATSLTNSGSTSVDPKDLAMIEKRKLSLYRGDNGGKFYIEKLLEYLDDKPLDLECWVELSDEYLSLGELEKAYECLMEVVVGNPFAYNIWSKIGEIEYSMWVKSGGSSKEILRNSIKHHLKALELCETYSRAWCGAFTSLVQLLDSNSSIKEKNNKKKESSLTGEEIVKYQKIHKICHNKLHEIVEKQMTNASDIDKIKYILQKYDS